MIQANELRVGSILNYYLDETEEWLPSILDWQDIKWISEDPESFNNVHKPIDLSEEILLKCGFEECNFTENHYNTKGMRIWKCNDIFLCDKNGVVIKSLHQLQNLYWCLCGKELEVKL